MPCTLYQCAGTRSRTGPAIPTVKRKLCGRKGPEVFQPRGGGVPRVTGSQHMEILLLALCKNGGGSLWMGSKRQIDLYLSNDQTRRHPQRKFRDSRVIYICNFKMNRKMRRNQRKKIKFQDQISGFGTTSSIDSH